MGFELTIARYKKLYAMLLRFYPISFRERFGEGMAQTFNDLCHERREAGKGLFAFVLRTYLETSAGIIRENIKIMTVNYKHIVRIAVATGCLLLIPLIAMQFTDEVNWDLSDFIIMGGLLFGVGVAYELIASRASKTVYRVAVGVALAAVFLLFWMNGAVGIIGNEGNPANLMYLGVILMGVIGAAIARLQSRGMARALIVTAVAQLLVPVIALLAWPPSTTSWGAAGVAGVFVFNAYFALMFAASAYLFHRAAAASNS